MKLYKVLKNGKSCQSGEFDWTAYLPRDGEPGRWTPVIEELSECSKGYHVTRYWNMWFKEGCEVYECEARGLVEFDAVGVIDKYVCTSVRLLNKLEFNLGKNRNTGDGNVGNRNTGDLNTGNRNTGSRNAGDWNTGNWNTGDRNTGHCNTGWRNTGNWNTGSRNAGDCNTGSRNAGDWNTGNWNTGHRNTGSFNTGTPEYFEVFNKPIPREDYYKINWPRWFCFDLTQGGYHASWKASFKNATPAEVQAATKLPNFDYAVFEEITGISKGMIEEKIGK